MQGRSGIQETIIGGGGSSFLYSCFEDFYCEVLRSKQKVLSSAWLQPDASGQTSTPEMLASAIITRFQTYFEVQEQNLFGNNLVGTVQTLYEEIKFAMVVLVDEIFLNIDWAAHSYWENNLLEQRIYGTHSGGQIFFQKIENVLQQQNPIWIDVARVYLAVLGLGFRGKYISDTDSNQLNRYAARLYAFINNKSPDAVESEIMNITPEATQETLSGLRAKDLPDTRNWYIAFTVIGLLYLMISYLIWHYSVSPISDLVDRVIENTNYSDQIGGGS